MVNQHLTCVNECTFMSICIAYYVNTYMYKCCFFHERMPEHTSVHFRTPFHWWWPISICSAVVQLKVYWSTANKCFVFCFWCAILIAHQIVMAKHGGSCVHFSGISTCGRTSRETVSHPQRQPLPTPYKIFLYQSMLLWQIHGCNL